MTYIEKSEWPRERERERGGWGEGESACTGGGGGGGGRWGRGGEGGVRGSGELMDAGRRPTCKQSTINYRKLDLEIEMFSIPAFIAKGKIKILKLIESHNVASQLI